MLIEFTLRNYLSFKEEATISFVASSSINSYSCNELVEIDNGKYSLLPFLAVYGANASGKSNLLRGLYDFTGMIVKSHTLGVDKKIPAYKPFLLDKKEAVSPTFFSLEFYYNRIRYFYSTEFCSEEIISEELYYYPEGRKAVLFIRNKDLPIRFGSTYKGEKKSIEKYVLKNMLFISRLANLTQEDNLLTEIYRYFRDNYHYHFKIDSGDFPVHDTTIQLTKSNELFKGKILNLLNAADFNIHDIEIRDDKSFLDQFQFPSEMPDKVKQQIINDFSKRPFLTHAVYNEGKVVDFASFDLNSSESTGTIKVFDLSGIIVNTLLSGGILVIDEINSGLHPYITQYISELFMNSEINVKHAQLLITTHDTYILDSQNIGRDQIWFTEKDGFGASTAFCLDEFDKSVVRKNVNFSKWYLEGRFRAVPNIRAKQLELWSDAQKKE